MTDDRLRRQAEHIQGRLNIGGNAAIREPGLDDEDGVQDTPAQVQPPFVVLYVEVPEQGTAKCTIVDATTEDQPAPA
jgi:hypothetical protein